MDLEDQIELIKDLCDKLDMPLREGLADVAKEHGLNISINVATSIGTSLLAIALVTMNDDAQEIVLKLMMEAVKKKLKEGNAAMHAELAIQQAKGGF